MRKVFLDELPRWESGTNKGRINWKKSVGYRVPFVYDDIEGEIDIVEYVKEKHMLNVEYKNNRKNIRSEEIQKCRIGSLIQKRTGEFKKEINDCIKEDKRDLVIIDREYRLKEQRPDKKGRVYTSKTKWYKYKCSKCGNEEWVIEAALITQGVGCNACCMSNKKAKLGINTVWDTDRWMCDLGVSEEDAKRYTVGYTKKINVICSNCNRRRDVNLYDIYRNKSIGCSCGDGYSYGHKYMYSLLEQLDIDFEEEVSFEWGRFYNKYKEKDYKVKYDFLIEKNKIIIEVDGDFHRMDNNMTGQSKEETEYIDSEKDRLAEENGYKLIRIFYDSLNIEIEKYIRDSELNKVFDLNNVNVSMCENFALNNNKVKDVCFYWNNKEEWETTQTVAKRFNTNKNTISKYLKKGTKLGWCDYDPKEEGERIRIANANKNKIKLIKSVEIFKDGKSLGVFKSLSELANTSEVVIGVKLQASKISQVCLGRKPQYKGFTFKYVNE